MISLALAQFVRNAAFWRTTAFLVSAAWSPYINAMDIAISGPGAASLPVGQTGTWTGQVSGGTHIWYRFRVGDSTGNFQMIRDYGPAASLAWAAMHEGAYQIEVSARDLDSGASAFAIQNVLVTTRVASGQITVNPTDHPLVFLFSAPPCEPPARMRVSFYSLGGAVQSTPYQNCVAGMSMNFNIAGVYAQTTYFAQPIVETRSASVAGGVVEFQTGATPGFVWNQTVLKPAPAAVSQPILLGTAGGSQIATDLSGNVMWFNPNFLTYSTRIEPGGYLWGFLENSTMPIEQQGIRMVDLVGNTILETNAARVNEQLIALGKHPITGFHHEVRTLPGGRIAALAGEERLLTDTQGPGTVDVLGDMIIVFDSNLQVLWVWDTFENLDVTRQAVLGEVCLYGGAGCAPIYLAQTANDWTHGNCISETPDGNLLYSSRHQDWLIKIAYQRGNGDGHIIWRLGKDGDFTFAGTDPYPWFSHQHDGNFVSRTRLTVFDNGNTRIAANGGNSRGQVIDLDETNRTATLALNADLGLNSVAVGSAQLLQDGNYHFDAGFVQSAGATNAYAFEIDLSGQVVDELEANIMLYRSIRLASMYGISQRDGD